MKFTVRSWAECDSALRARGSLTLWVTPEANDCWAAMARTTRDGQSSYSQLAIQTSLVLRLVFRQALRQTEGRMASLFQLLGAHLKAPGMGQPRPSRDPCNNAQHLPITLPHSGGLKAALPEALQAGATGRCRRR